MKTLIFPDIHTYHRRIDPVVEKERPDQVVLLGDLFDQYNDAPKENKDTASWYKASGYQWLYGNHDLMYGFKGPELLCSGFSDMKKEAINSVLSAEDWASGRFYTFVDGVLCTHAGLTRKLMPVLDELNTLEHCLAQEELVARASLVSGKPHWFWQAGRARGGRSITGGITWCDFNREFEPVPRLNQLFGHTTQFGGPRFCYHSDSSWNLCLDTNLRHYAVFEHGEFQGTRVIPPQ